MKTKRQIWLELKARSKAIPSLLRSAEWKDSFRTILEAPWKPGGGTATVAAPVDVLRGRVERHLMRGKATAADALMAAIAEDPQLYDDAVAAVRSRPSTEISTASKPSNEGAREKAGNRGT